MNGNDLKIVLILALCHMTTSGGGRTGSISRNSDSSSIKPVHLWQFDEVSLNHKWNVKSLIACSRTFFLFALQVANILARVYSNFCY